jgi:hypothetical protein
VLKGIRHIQNNGKAETNPCPPNITTPQVDEELKYIWTTHCTPLDDSLLPVWTSLILYIYSRPPNGMKFFWNRIFGDQS